MLNFVKKTAVTLIVTIMMFTVAFAGNIVPRYAVGIVSGFTDSSRTGYLDVTSIVPSPSDTIEHKFSADKVVAQNCPPGEECYDVMQRAYSGWSRQGQRLYEREIYGHTGKGRNPQVEGYRNLGR